MLPRKIEPSPWMPTDLVVRIFSFSFHQALPKERNRNGGGFVFDAAASQSWREERIQTITGKDAPVMTI